MKRKHLLFLLFLLIIPVLVFAQEDIIIKDVEFIEKSDSTILRREDEKSDTNLKLDYKFNVVEDYVKYKVTIVNNSDEEYLINQDSKVYTDDYVTYLYEFEDEDKEKIQPEEEMVLYVTASYDNQIDYDTLSKDKFIKDLNINLMFYTKQTIIDIIDNIVNPETGDLVLMVFGGLILSMLLRFTIKAQKKNRYINRIVILMLLMIPFIAKAVDEKVINFNLRLEIDKRATQLLPGPEVNTIFKQLANNNTDINNEQTDNNVTQILRADSLPSNVDSRVISTDYSTYEILAWYDNGIIYYYSEDPVIYFNEDSTTLFSNFNNLTNIDLDSFETDRTIKMFRLFYHIPRVTSLNLENFDTAEVTTMRYMFCEDVGLTSIDVSTFDTSNVLDMSSMFDYVLVTSLDLSNFDVRNVKDISFMFNRAIYLQDITLGENFNPKSATNFTAMFQYTTLTNVSFVRNWDMSSAIDIKGMFNRMYYLETLDGLETWDVSNVTNMNSLFNINTSLSDISAIANWDVSKVENMASLFWTTSSLSDFSALKEWKTYSVTDMSGFAGRSGFTDFSVLADWDVSHVTTLSDAFIDCATPTLEGLRKWDVSSVKDMNFMLSYTDITSVEPLKEWNVSNVENMGGLFSYTWLTSLDGLEDWDVSSVTNFGEGSFLNYNFGMFEGLNRLTDASAINDWEMNPEASFTHMFKGTNVKPEFTKLSGTWDDGTFIPE